MIQNPTILEKLKQKTTNDDIMRQFILSITTNESEGKQYRKFYTSEIEKCAKKRKESNNEI